MLIIWGSRLYGKVDEVPGLFHVATKFGHLWYIPLIPMSSHVIVEKTGRKFRGVSVGLQPRSVLAAWLRVLPFVAGAGFLSLAAALATDKAPSGALLTLLLLAGACAAVGIYAWVHKSMRLAGYERAVELARKVGLTPAGNVRLEMHFGNITQQEGQGMLAKFQQQRSPPAAPPALPGYAVARGPEPIELEPERK